MTEPLKLGRRAAARGALALGALAAVATGKARANGRITPIADERIALQLSNLLPLLDPGAHGGAAHTSQSLLGSSFQSLHQIGFRNVERVGQTLGLSVADYRAALTQNGFSVVSSFERLDDASWPQTLDQAVAFGQACVGADGFGDPGIDTLEHTLATAAHLNALGKSALDRGLRFFVHNQAREFTTIFPYDLDGTGDKRPTTAWEIVAANTDPAYVSFELDVHWVRIAFGLDRFDKVIDLISRYYKRIRLLHMQDTAADGSITDLGRGTTDWEAVIDAAGPGVLYYVWEYSNSPDPLKSAQIAYEFLKGSKV